MSSVDRAEWHDFLRSAGATQMIDGRTEAETLHDHNWMCDLLGDMPLTADKFRAEIVERQRGVERAALLSRLQSSGVGALPGFDLATAFKESTTEDWLLEPLIVRGGLTQLSSVPAEGKSVLSFDICMALANADRYVLGVKPVRPIRVVVVDFENDVQRDVGRWLRNLGYTAEPHHYENIRYVTMPSVEALNTPRGGASVLVTALEHRAELVVIDTLSRSIDGDENDASTFLNWYRFCGMPLKREGIACLRLDHLGKSAEKGARGSSAKMGDVDLAWELRPSDAATYRLVCTKHRMPLVETHLPVNRVAEVWEGDVLTSPLRHEVEVKLTEHEARVTALMKTLDDSSVPDDASVRTVKGLRDELEFTAKSDVIEDAVRRRKARAGRPVEDQGPADEGQP